MDRQLRWPPARTPDGRGLLIGRQPADRERHADLLQRRPNRLWDRGHRPGRPAPGAGDIEGAAAYRSVGLRLAAVLAAVPLVPFLVAPDRAFGLFTPDPRVVAVAASVIGLGVVATVPLVVGLNLGGVLRAAGDTRTVLSASVAGDVVLVPWPGCSPSASASACAASSSPGSSTAWPTWPSAGGDTTAGPGGPVRCDPRWTPPALPPADDLAEAGDRQLLRQHRHLRWLLR
jgi:hypothetical protein